MKKDVLILFVLTFYILIVFLFTCNNSMAMPAFARQYKTGCMTCHSAYPRLNAVGESFRLNGYKFPDDELYRKEERIDLGDEAYKRLWPDSVWPNKLSMTFPVSFITTWIVEWNTDPGISPDTGEDEADFKFMTPHEIEIAWAASLDDHMSGYGDLRFVQEDFSSENMYSWVMIKAWLQFEDLLGPENLLNLQVGSVGMHTIGLFNAREEQKIGFLSYLHNSWSMPDLLRIDEGLTIAQDEELKQFEGNTFVLQPQIGLELNGFGRNWLYWVGVVNGNIRNPMYSPPDDSVYFLGAGLNIDSKDFYAGFVYKFGGVGFDGSGAGDLTKASSIGTFWRDDSLLLSLFSYYGRAIIKTVTWDTTVHNPTSPHTLHVEYDDFMRLGAGLTWNYKDLSLNFGYMAGKNDNPYGYLNTLYGGTSSEDEVDSTAWFAEGNYFILPWLITFTRFESLEFDGLPSYLILEGEQDRDIFRLGCRAQIRANVSLRAEWTSYTEDNDHDFGLDKTLFFVLNASF